jgi:hypothetical protein
VADQRSLGGTALALAVDRATVAVVEELEAARLPYLLLKGPSTARWLYEGESRTYTDTDLLVDPSRHLEARELLVAAGYEDVHAGYRPSERNTHADTLVGPFLPGLLHAVDLHHRVELTGADPDRCWRAWTGHAEDLLVCGRPVRALDVVGRICVVALHAAQSGYADAKALGDVRRARARSSPEEWRAARRLAHELGSDVAFDLATAMCEQELSALRTTPEWRRADRVLRARVERRPGQRGARGLATVAGSRGRGRLALLRDGLSPSPARLQALHGPGPLNELRRRHLEALVRDGARLVTRRDSRSPRWPDDRP